MERRRSYCMALLLLSAGKKVLFAGADPDETRARLLGYADAHGLGDVIDTALAEGRVEFGGMEATRGLEFESVWLEEAGEIGPEVVAELAERGSQGPGG